MSTEMRPTEGFLAKALLVGLLPFLGGGGCTILDEVTFPPLVGPSEQGLSLEIQAIPSIINADGVSTATIKVIARNQDGRPVANRQLFFALFSSDPDCLLFAGTVFVGPLQSGFSLGTGGNGEALVTYRAGFSTGTSSFVVVQAYSFDQQGGGEPQHSVRIDQR